MLFSLQLASSDYVHMCCNGPQADSSWHNARPKTGIEQSHDLEVDSNIDKYKGKWNCS